MLFQFLLVFLSVCTILCWSYIIWYMWGYSYKRYLVDWLFIIINYFFLFTNNLFLQFHSIQLSYFHPLFVCWHFSVTFFPFFSFQRIFVFCHTLFLNFQSQVGIKSQKESDVNLAMLLLSYFSHKFPDELYKTSHQLAFI